MGASAKILFVTHNQAKGYRDDDLSARYAALSHAATVSHQKRRAGRNENNVWRVDPNIRHPSLTKRRVSRKTPTTDKESGDKQTVVPEPLTMLQKGASDPFCSTAVNVTPETNEIMSFFKNKYLPASYGTNSTNTNSTTWFQQFGAREEWYESVECLNDVSCGLAFVLTYATILDSISPNRTPTAKLLTLKSESFTALQASLAGKPPEDTTVLNCVLFLFASEAFAGNLVEATLHGKTLRRLIEQKADKEGPASIRPSLLTRAIWYDVHLSQGKMVNTIFDVEGRAAELLEPHLQYTNDFLVTLSEDFAADLDESMTYEPLLSAAIEYRQSLWLISQGAPVGKDGGHSASFWVLGKSYLNQGRLINYHLENKRRVQLAQSSALFWQTQSCLALGILLFVAQFGGDSKVSAQALLGTVPALMSSLRITLSSALNACTTIDYLNEKADPTYRPLDALLWAAFQGAQQEMKGTQLSVGGFGKTFAALTRQMVLLAWPVIKERLQQFLYSDYIEPNGAIWVDDMISRTDPWRKEQSVETTNVDTDFADLSN